MIRVCLVEDHRETREGFLKLLRHSPEIVCMGAYESAELAEKGIPGVLPDVVLMDINLPGRSGIECIAKLKPKYAQIQWLILTTHEDTDLIFSALKAGANGYLLKRSAPEELIQAIKDVHLGDAPMSAKIARRVVAHFHQTGKKSDETETLSPRESEILSHLAKGFSYKQIADNLNLSQHTVNNHLRKIYGKLHVQTRTEAVVKFLGQ
ncbi:MAG: response regulator transcription factor [Verrucomicrobia bacterium]|nr:response regulator transcription factor [Verrucomicrobiota bacterium]